MFPFFEKEKKKHANFVLVWNARDGKFINTLRGHVAPVYQCAFSPDSRLLVTGSKDTTLKVWDMRTHKLSVGKSPLLLFHEIGSLILSQISLDTRTKCML